MKQNFLTLCSLRLVLKHCRTLAARLFTAALLLASAGSALAGVHYVDANSTNATPPYTNWTTAATNIQDAVDAAVAGDEIVVTNGSYNAVHLDKPLLVRSENGPQSSTIDGWGLNPCAWLVSGARLSGFTLTGGFDDTGFGGGGVHCDSATAVVSNCIVTRNESYLAGGGAYGGTLNNCTLTDNSVIDGDSGGGAYGCTLNNCTLSGNRVELNSANNAPAEAYGGGAAVSTLNDCVLTGNSVSSFGLLSYSHGGGAAYCTLNNCTLTRNSANNNSSGGGAYSCALNNCIVYFNTNGGNHGAATLNYSCTTPLPNSGLGNITNAPLFADQAGGNLRLQSNSPCINAGNNSYVTNATDLDGNPRIVRGIVDIGAYESQAGVHYVDVNSTNATPPYVSWTTAATNIQDAVDAAVAGDEIVVTNGIYATGGHVVGRVANRVAVDKPLLVRSVNGPQFTTIAGGGSRCVYLTNGASLFGFTLTNGAAFGGGFSDPSGGGGGAYGGTLNNCTLTGNAAEGVGGGACNSTLNNCTLAGNWTGVFGGGAASCTLNNCTLTGNSTANYGGGAFGCTLNNCTLTGNSAGPGFGGGVYGGTLNNCIVYFNTATNDANFSQSQFIAVLNYCCTTPLPTNGVGNITNAPLFLDTNGWADLRLQSNSPCINAGNNSYATNATDLDGNPRIAGVGGTVDIGAYEFQLPTSLISYAWLQQYALPTDGSADTADPDGDGLNNWQEWRCATDPTNALSTLRLLTPVTAGTNVTVSWQSVSGMNYFLERSTNLAASPLFTPLATNIVAESSTTTYADTNALGSGPFIYRVGVSAP